MARHGLKAELISSIRQAAQSGKKVLKKVCAILQDGSQLSVNMTVSPILEHASISGLMMVSFEDTPPEALLKKTKSKSLPATAKVIESLQQQLNFTRENLQTTIEELETSNEELKSTNEELQSTNEVLQSLNEEAVTVNAELQSRIDELQSANDDMKNLFDSTQIATLSLDTQFCIRRFTPKVKEIIKLEATDIGRPIAHLASTLQNLNVTAASGHVLKTLEKYELLLYDDKDRYLIKHPQEVERLSKKVRVLHINNAAMALFKADSKEKLSHVIQELLIRRSIKPFVKQLLAIWNRQDKLSFECDCDDTQGNALALHLEWVAPSDVGRINYSNIIVVLPRFI